MLKGSATAAFVTFGSLGVDVLGRREIIHALTRCCGVSSKNGQTSNVAYLVVFLQVQAFRRLELLCSLGLNIVLIVCLQLRRLLMVFKWIRKPEMKLAQNLAHLVSLDLALSQARVCVLTHERGHASLTHSLHPPLPVSLQSLLLGQRGLGLPGSFSASVLLGASCERFAVLDKRALGACHPGQWKDRIIRRAEREQGRGSFLPPKSNSGRPATLSFSI